MIYSSAKLNGGLGNQMFQLSHAYVQAWEAQRKGINVQAQFINYADVAQFTNRQVFHYQSNILQNINFKPFTETEKKIDNWISLKEKDFSYNELTPTWNKSILFEGYYQSDKYFKDYENNIRELFQITPHFENLFIKKYEQLKSNTTCIQIRRGDYLNTPDFHPVITENYLRDAIEHNKSQNPEHYLVITDDYNWAREILPKYININKLIFGEESDWVQMWLGSLCSHFISSNSTFGWWIAFLSRNKNKQIIFPEKWFGPRGPQNWTDVYIKDSIVL